MPTDSSFRETVSPQPTTKRRIDLDGPDFYPTPEWCTLALLGSENIVGTIWEPCCGNGAMSEPLKKAGYSVYSTEMYDHGYGENRDIDFTGVWNDKPTVDNVITNPPYNSVCGILDSALRNARLKVCLLMRLAFAESESRYELFQKKPPSRIWVFSERPSFYPAGDTRDTGGSTCYAWWVWDKSAPVFPGCSQMMWIKPGYKPNSRRHANKTG